MFKISSSIVLILVIIGGMEGKKVPPKSEGMDNMKDQGGMPGGNIAGGMNDVDVNDVEANNVLDYVISQMNNDSTITLNYKVDKVKIHSIQEQVVAGTKFVFKFEIANTICELETTLNECPLMIENNSPRTCEASVIRLGDIYNSLTYTCDPIMLPIMVIDPPIDGGLGEMTNIDAADIDANRVLDDVVKHINIDKHWSYYYAKRSVLSISSQVVAGIKYNFSFIISLTKCTAENYCGKCEFMKGKKAKSRHCTASVVYKSWMPIDSQYSSLTHDCNMCRY